MRSSTLKQFYSWQVWIWFLEFQCPVRLHFISHSIRNAVTCDHTSLSAAMCTVQAMQRFGDLLAANLLTMLYPQRHPSDFMAQNWKQMLVKGENGPVCSHWSDTRVFFSPTVSLAVSLENSRMRLVPGMWPSFQLLLSMTERDCCWCYYKLCSNLFSFPFPGSSNSCSQNQSHSSSAGMRGNFQ